MKQWLLDNKKRILATARIVIIILVVIGLYSAFQKANTELKRENFQFANVNFGSLGIACFSYLLTMLCGWFYWHRVMVAMQQRPNWKSSLQASVIGQLGKYVPGKAMVVIIRSSMVSTTLEGNAEEPHRDSVDIAQAPKHDDDPEEGFHVTTPVAAIAVFVETLTYMAVGSFLAAMLLPMIAPDQPMLFGLSIGLMLCAGIPTLPPLFRKIVRILKVKKLDSTIDRSLNGLNYKLMIQGWIVSALAWFMNGFSLYWVLKSLPGCEVTMGDLPLLIACSSLAAVAGFLSLLPGGLGVRELVLIPLLSPFGVGTALVAAILLRIVWMVTELIASVILYIWRRSIAT